MGLDREQVIGAAVELLDEGGLDRLTMRRLAARLGVGAPTVYWHVGNKAALLAAVADVILARETGDLRSPMPTESWQGWLADLAGRLRRAMLAHPDGARVVAAAHLSLAMADATELAIRSLVDRRQTLREARLRVLSVEAFTLGHVLQEQSPRLDEAEMKGFDLAAFAAAHPTVVRAIQEYFAAGRTADDLFADELAVVLGQSGRT